jgi:5-dehydro-2-deoxygluconokinase
MTVPELLTIGRVSVDLYAQQLGVPMTDVTTFRKSVGGTSTNVAVAAARLGHRAATVTKVGDDPFGRYVRHALEHTFGVDTRWIGTDPELQTPLAFAELDPPEDPTIIFYRSPRAPDQNLTLDDLDLDVVREVPVLWIPASRFAWEPSRSTVREVLVERGRRAHTVLDLDWRAMFWASAGEAAAQVRPMLDHVTIAIGNRDECEIATGTRDPDEAADRLLERGLDVAVVKLGGDGVMVATADGTRERIPPFPVEVVCGLGAGDAFGGAFCHGLLSGWDLVRTARYGNAAGAIVAGRLMCADDMPTVAEIDEFLEERGAA